MKRKNQNSEWWNYEVKATVDRKESIWKDVLGESNGIVKERCMEI